jgi:hypothetical protein
MKKQYIFKPIVVSVFKFTFDEAFNYVNFYKKLLSNHYEIYLLWSLLLFSGSKK